MFCPYCGNQMKDGARFCTRCGQSVGPAPDLNQGNGPKNTYQTQNPQGAYPRGNGQPNLGQPGNGRQNTQGRRQQAAGAPGQKKKKFPLIPVIIGAVVIVVVIIIAVVLLMTQKPKIDVTENLSIVYEGPSGYASAELSGQYDWQDEAMDVVIEKYSYYSDEYWTCYDLIYNSSLVTFALDKTEEISNGDTLTVTVTIDEDAMSQLPFKLKGSSKEFEVSDLSEVGTIDLFENIEVSYSGYAPYASVSVSGTCAYTDVYYYCSDSNIDNGDTITIYCEYDADDLLEAGYTAESDSAQITVSGVDSYIMSLEEIPEAAMSSMQSQAEDVMAAWVANNWSDDEAFGSMTYLGSYLLTWKSSDYDSYSDVNRIYLVYEISGSNTDDGSFTYYTAFYYSNMLLLGSGDYSIDIDACEMVSNSYYPSDGRFYYKGYGSLETLFSKCVTVSVDEYKYESSIAE